MAFRHRYMIYNHNLYLGVFVNNKRWHSKIEWIVFAIEQTSSQTQKNKVLQKNEKNLKKTMLRRHLTRFSLPSSIFSKTFVLLNNKKSDKSYSSSAFVTEDELAMMDSEELARELGRFGWHHSNKQHLKLLLNEMISRGSIMVPVKTVKEAIRHALYSKNQQIYHKFLYHHHYL